MKDVNLCFRLTSNPQHTDTFCPQYMHLSLHHRRGKEVPAKLRGGKKATANRPQVKQ